jgi:hypothetical protein
MPKAMKTSMNGKLTVAPARPSGPTPLPMNILSTTL